MGADFLDQNGRTQPVIVGSYSIGITRMLSAAIKQNLTEHGITRLKETTPFTPHLTQMKMKDKAQTKSVESLYAKSGDKYDVLHDDRNEHAGVEFANADLVGVPLRITIGKRATDGIVEVKRPFDEKVNEVILTGLEALVAKELD